LEKHLVKVKFDAAISHGLFKLVLYFGDPRFSITHFQTDARSQRCGVEATVGVIDKFAYLFSISGHIYGLIFPYLFSIFSISPPYLKNSGLAIACYMLYNTSKGIFCQGFMRWLI
jgi:hypothetical protein